MTSQLGKQTIAIHILPSISRSKDNQAMKYGQLIEYNMRNILLEKSYTKCGGGISPTPFSKNQNREYLGINSLKSKTVCFYCMPRWDLLIQKEKEVWNQSHCLILCMSFEEKYLSHYILLPDQISSSGYFVIYWTIYCDCFVNQVVAS